MESPRPMSPQYNHPDLEALASFSLGPKHLEKAKPTKQTVTKCEREDGSTASIMHLNHTGAFLPVTGGWN